MRRNWEYIPEKELFLDAWDAEDMDNILNWFENVSGNNINLRNFGVEKEDIQEIVKLATTGGRMDNNPIVFDEDEIEDILKSVY